MQDTDLVYVLQPNDIMDFFSHNAHGWELRIKYDIITYMQNMNNQQKLIIRQNPLAAGLLMLFICVYVAISRCIVILKKTAM